MPLPGRGGLHLLRCEEGSCLVQDLLPLPDRVGGLVMHRREGLRRQEILALGRGWGVDLRDAVQRFQDIACVDPCR